MKLKHITFTGIDARTDIDVLKELQQEYPIVEFGVLASYHFSENGNRYLDPELISKLRDSGLNLALHLCGRAAHDAAVSDWAKVNEMLCDNLYLFKRCQLNISGRDDNPIALSISPVIGQEIIVQQKDIEHIGLFRRTLKSYPFYETFSVLLDASGGCGIDTPIQILKAKVKVGYAGGINPDNVAEKLTYLMSNSDVGDFWIDMESGVRTDDWFDVTKVRRVLEICDQILQNYEANR